MKKNPNLKYRCDIIQSSPLFGANDIFEAFISQKDNLGYIIIPNDKKIDVYEILNNKKILSLEGHLQNITAIKYFINPKNSNEYLISGDTDKLVIIWDIIDNYEILYKIKTRYGYDNYIFSCLLIFPHYDNNNYIITSSCNAIGNYEESSTKIFYLENGKFIKYIKNSELLSVFYLLSWYNKKTDSYYIIQLGHYKILINKLLETELYFEYDSFRNNYFFGLIHHKNNNDYLYASSEEGVIDIFDLYNKQFFQKIAIKESNLKYIIEWNSKYLIVSDNYIQSIKIIDLNLNKVISNIKIKNSKNSRCIKKIYHPKFGEILLSVGEDGIVKLWSI